MISCIGCMSAVKLVAYSTVDFTTIIVHAKILNGKQTNNRQPDF